MYWHYDYEELSVMSLPPPSGLKWQLLEVLTLHLWGSQALNQPVKVSGS